MHRGHKVAHPAGLEMPEGLDPSGVPCLDAAKTRKARSHRRHARPLPGLAPATLIASVEDVAAKGDADWLVWGSVGTCPVLFAAEAGVAAEMMDTVIAGDIATAIIEPWQVVLERLD
jgi:hypothetical protein